MTRLDDISSIEENDNLLTYINNDFFHLNQIKSKSKIMGLINKHIVFELWDKENHTIQRIPGKLLKYENGNLLIRQYDDGTEETKRIWTDYDGSDLFKDWEEEISIDNIRGIEEYKKINNDLNLKNEYVNKICEIINENDKILKVLIISFDGFEILFHYKYKEDNEECICENSYPIYLIKEIKVI